MTYGSNFIAGSNSIGTCVGFVWFCSVANFIVYQCMVSWTKGFQFCSYLQCNAFQGPNFIAPICFCMFFLHQSAQACACWRRGKNEQIHVKKHGNWMDLMGFDGFLHRASTCFKKKPKIWQKHVRFWVDLEGCNFIVLKNCLRSGAPIL